MPEKRKRVLSIQQKLEILQKLEEGCISRKISKFNPRLFYIKLNGHTVTSKLVSNYFQITVCILM
ncbi:hypothetical protein C0J52_06892 [Blattella germanica]|nr:hypothetical protein C0J52_06892 [Blattella germanica]